MAKYQKYAEYKDSGVEWLEEVPREWDIIKIKHLSTVKRGASPRPIDDPKYFDDNGEYAWVRIADVSASDMYLLNTTQTMSDLGSSLSVKLEPNQLFLSIAGTVGKPCINKIKACIHDGFVYFPELKIPNKYLFYVFAGEQAYKGLGKMGTQLNLNTDTVGDIKVALPKSQSDIYKIIEFLDHETTKIDHLIEKQQQLIELLKEKRQAVISHAVTKGLNSDVAMKDSGVEWLGEVPEHWIVSKLKYIKSHGHNAFVDGPFGSNLKSEHFVEDGDVYVIESNFATTGNLEPSNLKKITTKHFETICRSEAKGGDIIIAKIGARFGSSSILPILDKKAVVSGNSLKLTVNCKICDVNYANKLLQHLKNEGAIDDGVNGSAQPALSLGGLNTLPFLLPPLDEQIKIIQSLDLKVSKIDQVISQAKKQILLMQERRTALISAAVTGKIDVRHWQAPTVAEAQTELSA